MIGFIWMLCCFQRGLPIFLGVDDGIEWVVDGRVLLAVYVWLYMLEVGGVYVRGE